MPEYIDRQAATEFIDDCLLREEKLQSVEKETLLAVKRWIDAIPPADVRPVVRGFNKKEEWPSLFECSVCGWNCDDTTMGDTSVWNFCPNCGADMRGDTDG